MYLFTRQVLFGGDPREAVAFSAEISELVRQKTDMQVSVWAALLGAPIGGITFSTFVQSRAELDANMSTLLADPAYLDKVVQGQKLSLAPPQDQLSEILHSAGGEYRRADVGSVAQLITAQVSNARFGAALKWSLEMADLVSEITGVAGLFMRGTAGPFGQVGWLSTVPDMATVDAVQEALNKDLRYLTKLDEMGDLFLPGSGQISLAKRIA